MGGILQHKGTNYRNGDVWEVTEGTLMLDFDGPMVTINQMDPFENKETVFDSIHIAKHNVIRMGVHLLLDGANDDLSYKELQDTIAELQRRLKTS